MTISLPSVVPYIIMYYGNRLHGFHTVIQKTHHQELYHMQLIVITETSTLIGVKASEPNDLFMVVKIKHWHKLAVPALVHTLQQTG